MKPTKESHCVRILKYLKARTGRNGRRITFLSALRMFGCGNMKGRAHDIRKTHPNLKTEMVKTKSGKRIAQYFLA